MTRLGGEFLLGGDKSVGRMGFGTMRLPAWPSGRQITAEEAHAILRRAVELGVNHIDTAAFYRRDGMSANTLVREALHPYADDLVLVSKIGPRFDAPEHATSVDELREDLRANLDELGAEKLDLVNLRLIGEGWNTFDGDARGQFEALAQLREEGLVDHLGLSNVTIDVLEQVRDIAPVACVQNQFNVVDQTDAEMVDHCAAEGIGYVPFFPLGGHVDPEMLDDDRIGEVANRLGATRAQVALAWLLRRSPTILLIPGTASLQHLEQNIASTSVELSDNDFTALGDGPVNKA